MSGSYDAYLPQNKLQPIGENIWLVDGPVLQWGYGIPTTFPFPTRMTIIRLVDGGLFLHSPIAFDDALATAVAELGPVRHIVSPNMIHHVSIGDWAAHYPDARLWAAPGVRKRSDVAFTDDLGDNSPNEWSADIDQRIARGSRVMEEVVFFHKVSRTMILADLIENFEEERLHGGFVKFMYRLIGVMAPHGRAPADLRTTFMGRHHLLRPVVKWMLECNPKQIVIAHGRWFRDNATDEILRAFSWVKGIGSTNTVNS